MSNFAKLMQQAAAGVGGGDFYDYEIDNSVRFNPGDSPHLYRNSYSCSRTTWTVSFWVKRSDNPTTGTYNYIFDQGTTSGTGNQQTYFNQNQLTANYDYVAPTSIYATQADYIRDLSAWYHFVLVWDSTNATSTDRIRIYKNGVRSNLSASAMPSQNHQGQVGNSSYPFYIGRYSYSIQYNLDGYLADWHFIDGQALDSSYFGETKNGVWIPKSYSGTYSGNSYHLDFADSSDLGKDVSGNGIHFTSSGLTSSDQMIDTPTNSFATLNPLAVISGGMSTFSEGNLKIYTPGFSNGGMSYGTIAIPESGKWYFEFQAGDASAISSTVGISEYSLGNFQYSNTNSVSYYNYDGTKFVDNVQTSYGSSYVYTDIIGIAVDADADTITFYKNNVSQGSISHATSGLFPACSDGTNASVYMQMNFGQDSSFSGQKTRQNNTDANGIGDFYYTPPSGYLALCTANLPEPTIGPNSTTTSDENFNTVIFTGDGANPRSITGVGFQPDLVWFKRRSSSGSHFLFDAVRGVSSTSSPGLSSDTTGAEADHYSPNGGVISFDSDGFTSKGSVGNTNINTNGTTAVAWNWKGNGSGSSNSDGSITSTVSANTDAGISIVTYTGNGSNSQTVGHGLGASPDVVILKDRDTNSISNRWTIFHSALPTQNGEFTSSAFFGFQGYGSITAVSSSTFTLYGATNTTTVNESGDGYVAYCFAGKEGFSKFGSYTGNGSSDGPFIFTGMRPAWIMIKLTSAADSWFIFDAARNQYNVMNNRLWADSSIYESQTDQIDFLSNGFKLRNNQTGINASGYNYIYMAFAENPFKYANAR